MRNPTLKFKPKRFQSSFLATGISSYSASIYQAVLWPKSAGTVLILRARRQYFFAKIRNACVGKKVH